MDTFLLVRRDCSGQRWHAFAAFYNLNVGDYMMCKVTVDGFKMKVYDPISYDQKVVICREHANLE
jgi:hypothetical protein